MNFRGISAGICMCGSFCTFSYVFEQLEILKKMGVDFTPVMSYSVLNTDTRFGKAEDFKNRLRNLSEKNIICSIEKAEPIGPQNKLDIMIIAPCTGNTLAKLNNGIVDTPVLMAAKAHLRNNKPLLIALATNDALGINLENIGGLINRKNIYFVPFGQDDCLKKPKSMVAKFEKLPEAVEAALKNEQVQPIIM